MTEFRSALRETIEDSVTGTLEEIVEEEDDEGLETSEAVKPKAWFEFSFILKEHLQVTDSFDVKNPKKKKKTAVKLLS